MAFVDVGCPLHRLDEGGKFDHLRLQRRVEDPASANRNVLRTSLAARKVDLNADVSRVDASDANDAHEKNPSDDDHSRDRDHAKEILPIYTDEPLVVAIANVAIENRGSHRNLL